MKLNRTLNKKTKELNKEIKNLSKKFEFNKQLLNYNINPFQKMSLVQRMVFDKMFSKKKKLKGYNVMLIKNDGTIDFKYNIPIGKFLYTDYEAGQKVEYFTNLTENKVKAMNGRLWFIQVSGRPSPEPSNNKLDSKAFYEFYLTVDSNNIDLKKFMHRQAIGLAKIFNEKVWLFIIGGIIIYTVLSGNGGIDVTHLFGGGQAAVQNVQTNVVNQTMTTTLK